MRLGKTTPQLRSSRRSVSKSWKSEYDSRITRNSPALRKISKEKKKRGLTKSSRIDSDSYGEHNYESEFQILTREIATLQCELKPLKQNAFRLQNEILMHHRAITSYEQDVLLDSDALNQAVTAGDFSSAIVQFQNESNSLQHQLIQVRQLFSPNSLHFLRQEVEDGENLCAKLAEYVAETDREIQKNIVQYETYKLSSMYEDVQIQKEKIYHLESQLDEAMELHSKLKNALHLLSDSTYESSDFLDEANTIAKLTRKLNAARRKHFEQCELFLTIRNKQFMEVETVSGALQGKQTVNNAS